jgi:hypothetical protein
MDQHGIIVVLLIVGWTCQVYPDINRFSISEAATECQVWLEGAQAVRMPRWM